MQSRDNSFLLTGCIPGIDANNSFYSLRVPIPHQTILTVHTFAVSVYPTVLLFQSSALSCHNPLMNDTYQRLHNLPLLHFRVLGLLRRLLCKYCHHYTQYP